MSVAQGLELREIWHRYGSHSPPVLRGVSMRVEPGESIALMGPSGSGKTTLLTVLGLLVEPTGGEVRLDGRVLPKKGAELARLRAAEFGWVFQSVNVLPRRSALDNAALGLLARGTASADAKRAAEGALEAVGIGSLARQPVHTLSGGELQRVCIARVLAARPRFILADEPTGQLDGANTEGVIAALVNNRPLGTSVVIATHDPLVAGHCDRVLRLVDGEIVPGGASR
ncbi:MAG: ATP-binding cassette domain-containing protein [Chloroflexi bacterium]|nr:ATP-binding cassette domain-containing protein [Chloroflexota bacterium]